MRDEQSLPRVLRPSKSISRRGQFSPIVSDVSTDSPLPLCCPHLLALKAVKGRLSKEKFQLNHKIMQTFSEFLITSRVKHKSIILTNIAKGFLNIDASCQNSGFHFSVAL